MNYEEFKRVLTSFADTSTNIDTSKGKLICEIRDEMIEATTSLHEGEVWVNENGQNMRGTTWLLKRVARVPILADRILTAFREPDYFISPKADLLDQLDDGEPDGKNVTGDATELTLEMLSRRPGGCSSVLYLTSDAGEGKTTLIAHLARLQAEKFKRKETDWLLVPIALGGKPFLRFDDLVVGFLGNRLRFPLYYFEAFMELVRLGVLVPAFDGFEEMFVQDAKGDAFSAIGNLMRTMDSSGTVLIAARKAYFEYQDVRMQARLFDSIGTSSVVFSRLKLLRWGKAEFLGYSDKRQNASGAQIHALVADRLGETHPLLTRAVLVKRLLDVAEIGTNLTELLRQIGNSPNDYFAVFVNAIIEREANEKWIDTSGEAAKPLLSVKDHADLLSAIAQEMWTLSTDNVKAEVLDLITDLFCEGKRLTPAVAFQVKERTKQHALVVSAGGGQQTFAFDHEEFKNFFLGEAIGRLCAQGGGKQKSEVLGLLRKGNLPAQACEAAISVVRRTQGATMERMVEFLQEVGLMDSPSSFTQENAARMIIKILHEAQGKPILLSGLGFGSDALRGLHLSRVTFVDCSFRTTSLENTVLKDCHFENCHFEKLELHVGAKISGTKVEGGDFGSIVPHSRIEAVFDPKAFPALLRQAGFAVPAGVTQPEVKIERKEDPNVKLLRRLVRCLQFRTHINENVVLRKMGPGAEMFVKSIVPKLVKENVLGEEWIARDKQHRYHLGMSMERVQGALDRSGTIAEFLSDVHGNAS